MRKYNIFFFIGAFFLLTAVFANALSFGGAQNNYVGDDKKIAAMEARIATLEAQNRVLISLIAKQAMATAKLAEKVGLSDNYGGPYGAVIRKSDTISRLATEYVGEMTGGNALGSEFANIASGLNSVLGAIAGSSTGVIYDPDSRISEGVIYDPDSRISEGATSKSWVSKIFNLF